MQTVTLPQSISDGRLDTVLKIFFLLKGKAKKMRLDWSRVSAISPAGYAILACLFDTVIEQHGSLRHLRIKKKFKTLPVIQNLLRAGEFQTLPDPGLHNFQSQDLIFEGSDLKVNLSFMDRVDAAFNSILSEDMRFSCRLILNELMINCIDHSTAERYFLYAGKWEKEFHIGVLDMGITIPAKLERKYIKDSDVALLEHALKEGVTTRRQRMGGFGLAHTFDVLKNHKGKLTILSRGAQVRRYFNRGSLIKGKLKHILDGTWCFTRFPLEK